jgi:hypothetical protein
MEKDISNIQSIGSKDQIVIANVNDFFFLDALYQEVRVGDICMAYPYNSRGMIPCMIMSIRIPIKTYSDSSKLAVTIIEYITDNNKTSSYCSYSPEEEHSRHIIKLNNPEFFFPTPLFRDVAKIKLEMNQNSFNKSA